MWEKHRCVQFCICMEDGFLFDAILFIYWKSNTHCYYKNDIQSYTHTRTRTSTNEAAIAKTTQNERWSKNTIHKKKVGKTAPKNTIRKRNEYLFVDDKKWIEVDISFLFHKCRTACDGQILNTKRERTKRLQVYTHYKCICLFCSTFFSVSWFSVLALSWIHEFILFSIFWFCFRSDGVI